MCGGGGMPRLLQKLLGAKKLPFLPGLLPIRKKGLGLRLGWPVKLLTCHFSN